MFAFNPRAAIVCLSEARYSGVAAALVKITPLAGLGVSRPVHL